MKWIKYILLALLFLFSLIFTFILFRGDTFVNYGFSYAIKLGEIPYKDFNMVITPFSPFLYSIGLWLHSSILMIYLEQAILLVVLFFLMKKLLGNKVLIFYLLLCLIWPVSFPSIIYPGYNFLCFLLLIVLIILEERKRNDWLIGLLIGVLFCTKQTIGIAMLFPSILFFWKDGKKLMKRIGGFLIPCIILFLYLVITNSMNEFMDLCFFGLFSFGNSNKSFSILCLFSILIGLIYLVYRILKNKKEIINYYFLLWIGIIIPIIDYYHAALFLIGPSLLWLKDLKIENKYNKMLYPLFIILYSLSGLSTILFLKKPTIANFHNFPLYVVKEEYKDSIMKLNNYLKKDKREKILLLRGSENYMLKIMNNDRITYYDLPNYGNYGYNGEKKIKEQIKNRKDIIFVVDSSLCTKKDPYQQFICSFKESAIKNSELIKVIDNYEIYERK